jgi:hypothetical protein
VIYEGSPARYLPSIAAIMLGKLKTNNRCLYLNSPVMVAGIRSYLAAEGLDVAQEVGRGALVLSSDQSHLVDGRFQVDNMLAMLKDSFQRAMNDGYQGLWATGDMTWEFGTQATFSKLLQYEYGLEDLLREHPTMGGICQYHKDILPTFVVTQALLTHRAVYINDMLCRINPYYVPSTPLGGDYENRSVPRLDDMLNHLRRPAGPPFRDTK